MSSWHKLFLLAGFITVLGAFCFIVYFYDQFNDPVNGTISVSQQSNTVPTSSIDLTSTCSMSPYDLYCRPEGLLVQPAQPLQGPVVELSNFMARDTQSWLLSIEVDNGTGNLSNDSAYTYREHNSSEYLESRMIINGQTVEIMQDKYAAGFSKVAFLTHNSYTATVSLTGDDQDGAQPLTYTFMMVLESWQWK